MAYEHDEQVRIEASMFPLPSNRIDDLTARVSVQRNAFGEQGVRGHRISYEPHKWNELLPSSLRARDSISRSEVFELAETGVLTEVFTACFVWGVGRVGYGPHRYSEIVNSTAGLLDEMLHRATDAAAEDVISGYSMLYGGDDPKRRAAANEQPWTRIHGFGPAFFTKFLYFTTPGALILDNVLARRVSELSGMPYLVRTGGQSYDWSPYRYAVYLHWMSQTASKLNCTPEELELTLFSLRP